MTERSGKVFGTYGAFAALPHRLLAKEAKRQGILLKRGTSRRTTRLVFGRELLETAAEAAIEERHDAELQAGHRPLSENGFLRLLGLAKPAEPAELSRQSLLDQSHLEPSLFDLLSLFDAYEHDEEPYSFRDLILVRKYAGLVASGANWSAIARSIHRSGPVESLTALSLHAADAETIYALSTSTRPKTPGWKSCSSRLSKPRPTTGMMRPQHSISVASPSIRRTLSPPSTARTACALPAAMRKRRTTMPARSSSTAPSWRPGSISPA